MKEIYFNVPLKLRESVKNVKKFLNSNQPIHGPGENINKIKNLINKNLGLRNIFLTNSCTSALEICSLAINLKKTDEVIVPSFSFITSASSFARTGCKLKFCDIQKETLMPSLKDIQKCITKNTKAIVVVHYQGYSVEYLDKLKKICNQKKIFLIEDAAQAFGSYFKNKSLGSFGDFSCFSFHETKNLHSGSGGMLIVNNKNYLNKIKTIYDKGTNRYLMNLKKIKYYSWVEIGSAFLMTEFAASYLSPQIKNYKRIFLNRSKLYHRYINILSKIKKNNFYLPNNYKYRYNFHAIVLILENTNREKFLKFLKKNKINAVISYTPLHKSKFGKRFFNKKKNLINTDKYVKKIVRLPLHDSLTFSQIDYICKKIQKYFNK
jgi:dTDP-4-amino-4,6-dideoxygalactose transaminase